MVDSSIKAQNWTQIEKVCLLKEQNGFEAQQSSLLDVIFRGFGFDRVHNKIVVHSWLRN